MNEFSNGDVVVYEDEQGERQTAIRRGYGFANWVVANWGFKSLSDVEVDAMVAKRQAVLFPNFAAKEGE